MIQVRWWTSTEPPRPQGGARPEEVQMAKSSSHRRWKGHCLMCASGNGKFKRDGDARRTPFRELKKIGVKRRFNRNAIYEGD